ncbi:MAG: glycosyltransferase [Kiritimatiellae bacterium]|nr:glycosyltransferase [Kiritimatiellia bacterium]
MICILQVLEAAEGGARRHLRDLADALDPSEFSLEMAVSCRRDPDFRKDLEGYESRGIRVHEIPMRRRVAPLHDLWSFARLVACIRAVRPDVVHAHSSKAGVLARLAGRICGVPVVYTAHGLPFLMRCNSASRRFYRFVERSLAGCTHSFIAVSGEEYQAALSIGHPPERVRLIPNGIKSFDAGEVIVRDSGVLQVGFFGRLSPQKAPELLIESAAEVAAHLPQTSFTIYGDGELRPKLANRIARLGLSAHVRLAGAFEQGAAVSLMRMMDVVAIPSLWEGCPYVVMEAFQAGVPVVAARVGGISDLIVDGVNGVLIEAGSTESLCDGLLRMLRDAGLRGRLARRGREDLARHTLEQMTQAVGTVYRQAAGLVKQQRVSRRNGTRAEN